MSLILSEARIAEYQKMTSEELVDIVVDAMKARDTIEYVGSIGVLSLRDTQEIFLALTAQLAEYIDAWGSEDYPERDSLGDPGVCDVIARIKAVDLPGLFALANNDPAEAITMLAATAAVLKRN